MKRIILCVLIIGMGSLSAQTFSGKINPYPSKILQLQDTIKILAVMVDFPEDTDGSTFGNGKFGSLYSKDYGLSIIDPLPHDINYFSHHLTFLNNYYNKTSGQQVNVTYSILPDVITVSKTMRNYSPPPGSEDLSPVAEFAREVWEIADSLYPSFQFSQFDVFFILHAGAGRDISLPGSLGNERDLPSVYFSPAAFENLLPGFTGFAAGPDNFRIMNSAIIPETESRELSSFGSTVLFELSINGLMAATLASYMGLPDLFDTETGLSAIGRFGLMDGQAIFAYNGLFPPELSAWEKSFLGWKIPSDAALNKNDYNLVPGLIPGADTTILKINLSSSEYFLLENRQRDVNSDGAIVTYVSNGEIRTKTFLKDTTGFYSYSVDSLEGVIIDVDEFDWALPGSGIVIWHIDENIIADKISENKINVDKDNRGVDVEEADGIQDIGVEFQTIFGDIVIGEGEQRDMWYASNDADLYTNRFSKDTRPDTRTNSGANSLVTISGFSEISNRMNFKVIFGDSIIKPVVSENINLPSGNAAVTYLGNGLFGFTADNDLFISDSTGQIFLPLNNFSKYKPASVFSGDTLLLAGADDSLKIYVILPTINPLSGVQFSALQGVTSNPVIVYNERKVFAGAADGKVFVVTLLQLPNSYAIDSVIFPELDDVIFIAADNDYFSAVARKGSGYVLVDNNSSSVNLDIIPTGLLLTRNSSGGYVSVILSDSKILIAANGIISASIQKDIPSVTGAALTDLKQDGNNYIAFNDGNKIKVYNLNGFPADNFPYTDQSDIAFDNFILAADFEGDKASEIIAASSDGRIFAIDGKTGKSVSGFPLSAGKKLKTAPVIYNGAASTYLSVLDSLNNFYIWNISSIPGNLFWYEQYGNPANTAFIGQSADDNFVNTFFPSEKIYSYPNPVYDGNAYIRYYVSGNSRMNIKIFDLAGALVEELNSSAIGGSDNEILWNVSDIQSGVYLARIEATGNNGNKETNIIKIAVVK